MLFSCDQQSLLDNYVVATAASPVWEEKQKSVKKFIKMFHCDEIK